MTHWSAYWPGWFGSGGGRGGADPALVLAKRFEPLILQQTIQRPYMFTKSGSGRARRVDFFANSTTNIALDTVRLGVSRAEEILLRADAEAFKVTDILSANNVQIIVYCALSQDPQLEDTNAQAKQVIGSTGAMVTGSVDDAARQIERYAGLAI